MPYNPFTLPLRATVFVLVAAAPLASAVELRVKADSSAPISYQAAAWPSDDASMSAALGRAALEMTGTTAAPLDLPLDPKVSWRIEITAEGYWSEASWLGPGRAAGPLEVSLLEITRFELRSDSLPEPPRIDFSAPEPPGKNPNARKAHRVACRQADQPLLWRCEVPRGTWDLRLSVEGRVPRYFWNVRLGGASYDAGKVIFLEGASVAGYVVSPDRQVKGCKVEAFTVTAASVGLSGEGRAHLSRFEATVDERGFFQLSGLPPGSIRLEASKAGLDPASVGPLTVLEGRETILDSPLEIGMPRILGFVVEPPLDPYEKPWRLKLLERFADSNIEKSFASGSTGADGRWFAERAHEGQWRILISDSRDNRWSSREFSWQPGDPELFLDIDRLPVRGSVSMGDEAVRGAVLFGTSFGSRSLRFELDEEGHYSGFLPEGGQWKVELLDSEDENQSRVFGPFEVAKRPGKSYAEIDLRLPDTQLSGQVLQDGEPVAGARLTVLRYPENRRRDAFAATREEGRFELKGLEPGSLVIQASKGDSLSEWTSVSVAEGVATKIELILEKNRHLQGQVLWRGGVVPGATVVALFVAAGRRGATRAVAGFDGAFDLKLPASAKQTTLLVLSPAFDIGIASFSLSDQNPPAMIELTQQGGNLVLHGQAQAPDAELRVDSTAILIRELWQQIVDRLDGAGDSLLVRGLPPGLYQVCSGENSRPPCSAAQLPTGGTAEIHLDTKEYRK